MFHTAKRILIFALLICLTVGVSAENAPHAKTLSTAVTAQAESNNCKSLIGTTIGQGQIKETESVKRGSPLFGFWKRVMIKLVWSSFSGFDAPRDFCRVTAKITPVENSEITFEAWLPQQWNGKLLGVGGGGFNGGLGPTTPMTLAQPVGKGYTAFVTDAGHEQTQSAKFAYDNPEQLVDFAYRANHVAATFAKQLVNHYYKVPASYAYFHGCSNGGRDALMEAQRFPDDYDGIIAGAPAAGWTRLMTSFPWQQQVLGKQIKKQELERKLGMVQEAVMQSCDGDDGLIDGIISNPGSCSFDPAQLKCQSDETSHCLTEAEVNVLQELYRGPHLKDGSRIYPGLAVGGEAVENNWDLWVTSKESPGATLGIEFFRWVVHANPSWNPSTFDLDNEYLKASTHSDTFNSDNPDLTPYLGKGGKLLLYHGWNDAAIPPAATIEYFESLQAKSQATEAQARLFMVPGMQHCFGGNAPSTFDPLESLAQWVEQGVAPEQIIATEYEEPALIPSEDNNPVRSRPLCPWPKVAHYNGSGSVDDAASFSCR